MQPAGPIQPTQYHLNRADWWKFVYIHSLLWCFRGDSISYHRYCWGPFSRDQNRYSTITTKGVQRHPPSQNWTCRRWVSRSWTMWHVDACGMLQKVKRRLVVVHCSLRSSKATYKPVLYSPMLLSLYLDQTRPHFGTPCVLMASYPTVKCLPNSRSAMTS